MSDFTEVFVWGSDHFGQLGLGSKQHKTYSMPKFCSFNILIRSISCGDQHSGFISDSGHVYTMGSNLEGRLGIPDQSLRFSASPVLVESLESVDCKEISCGGGHSLVLAADGSVFAWGFGETGALGTGSLQTQWAPVSVKLPSQLRPFQISCGSKHSGILARARDGNLILVSGNGDSGQLGTGKREREVSFVTVRLTEEPVQISCGVFHTGALGIAGNVYMTGGNAFGQLGLGNKKGTCIYRKIESLSSVKKISCSSHSAALTNSGDVYVWGTGIFGELVSPTRISTRCKDLSVGGNFTILLDDRDNLYSWGNNLNGELGLGDFEARSNPVHINSLQGKKIQSLACGSNFALVLGEDVRYQSGKHKSSTPLRQTKENDDYSIPINPSPKNNSRVLGKKNVYEYEPVKESQKTEVFDKNNDFYLREIERVKDENYKLLVELEREQSRAKQLVNENEDLRRVNESLKTSEGKLQHVNMVSQTQALEAQRLRVMVEEAKHMNFSLEVENKALKEEVMRQEGLIRVQEKDFLETMRIKLAAQESHMLEIQHKLRSEYETKLESFEIEIKQLESNLSLTQTHKSRLEDVLSISSAQIGELENQMIEQENKIKLLENNLASNSQIRNRIEENLNDSNQQIIELSSKVRRYEAEISQKEEELNRVSLSKHRAEEEIELKTGFNNEMKNKLEIYEQEINRLQSELNYVNNQKNKLEDVVNSTSCQNLDLANQVQVLRSQHNELETSKVELIHNLESIVKEHNELKVDTVEKEAQREDLIKLIEEKMQELENDRSKLVSEKDLLNRSVSDLTFEIAKLNQHLSESNYQVRSLEDQLAQEISRTSRLMIDLETAKEEIVLLELKNREIFDNLQRELAQRAKDYKERTLNLINTPSRNHFRQTPLEQSMTYNYSPAKETINSPDETEIRSPPRARRSPTKETLHYSTMPSIDLMGKTPHRSSSLSKSQQDRINAAALKLLKQHESPLRAIRVSSPARRSPTRPSPYRTYA